MNEMNGFPEVHIKIMFLCCLMTSPTLRRVFNRRLQPASQTKGS